MADQDSDTYIKHITYAVLGFVLVLVMSVGWMIKSCVSERDSRLHTECMKLIGEGYQIGSDSPCNPEDR